MALNFNATVAGNLRWFMLDLTNRQLITGPHVPDDIKDTKEIVLTETPIPGQNFSPIQTGGMGNRKLSFTIPLIKRNNTVGNMLLLKQFHTLRNKARNERGGRGKNPRVLYYWGIGSLPQVYYVKKCDVTNKKQWVNQFGYPTYSEIQIELWQDYTHPVTRAEEEFRDLTRRLGIVLPAFDIVSSALNDTPY